MKKIYLYGFLPESKTNGPGNRAVIWTQGCDKSCSGCWNPESLDLNKGISSSIDSLLKKIDFEVIRGVTFSGGEPFLQSECCYEIAKKVKANGKDIVCFTGYQYEELLEMDDSSQNFLKLIDILIDGPYESDKKPKHPWAGSGNQRVLKLLNGKIDEEIFWDEPVSQECEIIIDKSGQVTTTGF